MQVLILSEWLSFFAFSAFCVSPCGAHRLISSMQAIITEINEKIGAAGVVSQECKTVVSQYGQQILALLLAEVRIFSWVCLWVCLSISGLINCVCTTLK
jgi:hypothetical protein